MPRPLHFKLPPLPKEDYAALQWAREELGPAQDAKFSDGVPKDSADQLEVVLVALRLLHLMLKEGLNLEQVGRTGQRDTVKALLRHLRERPRG